MRCVARFGTSRLESSVATLLKVTLLHRCFSRFLNGTNVPNRARHYIWSHDLLKERECLDFTKLEKQDGFIEQMLQSTLTRSSFLSQIHN